MKKLLSGWLGGMLCALALSTLAFIGGGVGIHNHSSTASGGLLGFVHSPTSSKACAAGYTRTEPNFCVRNTPSFTALTRDACTTVAAPDSDATAVLLHIQSRAVSGNVAATQHNATVNTYSENTCATNQFTQTDARGFEFTAVVGATLGGDNKQAKVRVFSGNFFIRLSDDIDNQGTGGYEIQGYFD